MDKRAGRLECHVADESYYSWENDSMPKEVEKSKDSLVIEILRARDFFLSEVKRFENHTGKLYYY